MLDVTLEKIEAVLDTVRPRLAMHAGDIELVDYQKDTGEVRVRFKGACVGCPLSDMTLKMGIESVIKESFPSVTRVINV